MGVIIDSIWCNMCVQNKHQGERLKSQSKNLSKVSEDEIQKFICEQFTKLNNKQDRGEQMLGELKAAMENSTATIKEALKITKQLSAKSKPKELNWNRSNLKMFSLTVT